MASPQINQAMGFVNGFFCIGTQGVRMHNGKPQKMAITYRGAEIGEMAYFTPCSGEIEELIDLDDRAGRLKEIDHIRVAVDILHQLFLDGRVTKRHIQLSNAEPKGEGFRITKDMRRPCLAFFFKRNSAAVFCYWLTMGYSETTVCFFLGITNFKDKKEFDKKAFSPKEEGFAKKENEYESGS